MLNFNDIKQLPGIPELIAHEGFRAHYVNLYNDTHRLPDGSLNNGGAAHYLRETTYLKQMLLEDDAIRKATPLSMTMALIDLASHGVTIRKTDKALAYIFPRGGGNKVIFDLSPYGGLAIRLNNKVITSINGPILVMEGDELDGDGINIFHKPKFKSDRITGAWMRVNRPDRTREDKYFSIAQILSYRDRGRNADSVGWTGGVPYKDEEGKEVKQPTRGMIEAKVIQHTLDTYPLFNMQQEAAYANTFAAMATGGNADLEAIENDRDEYSEEAGNEQNDTAYQEQEQERKAEDPKPEVVKEKATPITEKKAPVFNF